MQSADWLPALLGVSLPKEAASVDIDGRSFTMVKGILRAQQFISDAQNQTSDTFGFKWSKRDTFEGETVSVLHDWLIEKYGEITAQPWFTEHGDNPVVLDAGCGASLSGLALFGPAMDRIRYLGVDISTAIDTAKARFSERGIPAGFLQCDLTQLPLSEQSVDIIFSEGVLHHTDDTQHALGSLVRFLKPGGRILFYVYRKKGPIREFTDDHIRAQLQSMTPQERWDAVEPLTRLGILLGELDIEIDVPDAIDILDIPAGKTNLQRLFYWHIFKIYYRPEMTLNEMNHLNFDWYAPRNAHRHSLEEVQGWCEEFGLTIEKEKEEMAGITIIARAGDVAS